MVTAISFFGCGDLESLKEGSNPPVDPLESVYAQYLSECSDFGGGMVNQIYVNITKSTHQISIGILTWTHANCMGTYALTDGTGNPIEEPQASSTLSYVEVSGIPENFYVIQFNNILDVSVDYALFHLVGDHLDVLNPFLASHATWAEWLLETDVPGFVEESATFIPSTLDIGITHLNKVSALPNPISVLNGHWISDCADFGGGMNTKIYAEVQDAVVKNAVLTWSELGCTGSYTLTDIDGHPVTEAAQKQNLTMEHVIDTPAQFFVAKVEKIDDPLDVVRAVLWVGDGEFYELIPYEFAHASWSDWLLESDVTDFAIDPVLASPMAHLKLHFVAGELP